MGKGILAAVCSAAFIASGVVFVRFAYQSGLQPGTALILRFGIAAFLIGIYLWVSRRWVSHSKKEVGVFLLLGFVAYTTLGATWFVSLSLLPAWLVSLFSALQPLLIILGSWAFLKGDFTPKLIIPLSAVVAGGILLFWQPFSSAGLTGILLMILNLLVYSAYILIGQSWINRRSPEVAVFWVMVGATIGSVVYASVVGEINFDFELIGWFWVFCLAFVATVLAITFLWYGIRILGPSRSSIFGALDPVFSVLLAVFILGEKLSLQQIIGGVLIVCGVSVVRFLEK